MLLNYSKENVDESISKECICIANAISFANKNKDTLTVCISKLSGDQLKEALSLFTNLNNNISNLQSLEGTLANLKNADENTFNKGALEYNNLYNSTFSQLFNISSLVDHVAQYVVKNNATRNEDVSSLANENTISKNINTSTKFTNDIFNSGTPKNEYGSTSINNVFSTNNSTSGSTSINKVDIPVSNSSINKAGKRAYTPQFSDEHNKVLHDLEALISQSDTNIYKEDSSDTFSTGSNAFKEIKTSSVPTSKSTLASKHSTKHSFDEDIDEINEEVEIPRQQSKVKSAPVIAKKHTLSDINEVEDNDTLLISEKENKVFLPYKVKNIEKILTRSKKYATVEDIIDDLYTVPLSNYAKSSSARFREGFNLMRNKESASVFKSIDLGLELAYRYDLNPAIISACQNLDELDIYLDYLDSKEVSKFNIFNVQYDVTPRII